MEYQFLDLLHELREEFGLTIMLITHNIGVVAEIADRLAVMYAGKLVEIGDCFGCFGEPKHPYTQGLLRSVPNIKLDGAELYKMKGAPPKPPAASHRMPFSSALSFCDGYMPG